ncbi:spermatogenesis-associated protein 31E1-like [Peromyscus californicus insignis]|uniref:spermatogenesis-associated protein 31E1-like n=1 Tax=Peromyscus californicus insignis TaxID=564181 RepID=UPI0022A7AE4C|nr:spermatogenesis-associated protein 31E1-like [Peromyscus californicus insignis]
MESSLLWLKSLCDSWMSLSCIFVETDVIFGVMCGVGFFFLLTPFLKTYPVSPPPGSRKNTPKVRRRRRRQIKTREKNASVKGCRDGRKNVEDTQNASQPVEIPINNPLLDSTPHAFWNSYKKLYQLPLSQLLSYLKILEDLMQRKFSQTFWSMSSVLSESVVATAWVSRRSSFAATKTSPFCNTHGPSPALPLGQGPPQISQAQPLPDQFVTSSLADVTEVQTLDDLPSSIPNQALSVFISRVYGTTRRDTGMKVLASPPTENRSWQQDLEWKDTIGSNVQKHQAAISQPTYNLPRDIPPAEAIGSASIPPERCQFLQHREEPLSEYSMSKVREQGPPFRFLPSRELTQLQGHLPANNHCQSKNKPELPQPAQPSILDSKSCKLSQMMRSVPLGMPLKKGPAKCNVHDPIKKGPSFRAKDLPCTSSSTPGQGLGPRNPAMRTDHLSHVNTTQDLSFLDLKTQRKLDSNIKQLRVKHRWKSYLQTLVSSDLTQPGVPASFLPQPVYPTSPSSVSKSEDCLKTATILEKLHHQDPGGTRIETVSASRLQGPLFAQSPSEVQEMQRATLPAASQGPLKAHPVTWKSNLITGAKAYCLLAKTQKSRIIRGIGRGSLQPRTSPRIVRHESWTMFENVATRHPYWSGTLVDPEERTPSSVAKQINRILEVIKETPSAWKVTLGSSKILNGQNINFNLRDFESVEANRNPGHFQTCPQHSSGPALKPQVLGEVDFKSNEQPQSWPAGLLPDRQSAVCSTTVSLPTQHSVPRFQNRSKNPKTSQGLDDVFKRRNHHKKTQKLSVPKDKIQASNHKIFPPSEERKDCMRSRVKSQEENLGRMGLSQARGHNSSTQPKDTVITESQPSPDMLENKQAPERSFLKKMVRNILQYLNLSAKDKEQGDSLKSESHPSSTKQTQEVVTKDKLIYSLAARVQSLMKVMIQVVMDRLDLDIEDPSKAQWCEVESLTSQPSVSSHSSEGLHDTKKSITVRRMSFGPHTSSKGHNHPLRYRGIGDKQQLSVDAQKAYDQHQNRVKRGMDFNQLPTLKGKSHPFLYRRTGDKQQSGTASKTACDPDQIKVKSGMGYCLHNNSKGHNHPFLYREIGNKQQSNFVHRACDPPKSTKKVIDYGHLNSLKENNHPVMFRGTGDTEQSYAAAQTAGHPKCTLSAQARVQVSQVTLTFAH